MTDYYVTWWNLENLFDVENSAQRPDWLRRHLKKELVGWDQQVLDKKIGQLSKIVSKINNGNGLIFWVFARWKINLSWTSW